MQIVLIIIKPRFARKDLISDINKIKIRIDVDVKNATKLEDNSKVLRKYLLKI